MLSPVRRPWRSVSKTRSQALALSRELRGLGASPPLVLALSCASVGSGLSEAAVVGLVVQGAAAIAAGKNRVDINLAFVEISAVTVTSLLLAALVAVIVRAGLQLAATYLPIKLGARAGSRIRSRALEAYLSAEWPAKAGVRQGGFVDLLGMQAQLAADAVTAAISVLGAVLTFLTLIGAAALISPVAFLGAIIVGSLLFALLRPVTRIGQREAVKYSDSSQRFGLHIDTAVTLAEEMHAFGVGPAVGTVGRNLIDDSARARVRMELAGRSVWPVYQSVSMLLVVAMLFALSRLEGIGVASIGAVVLILLRSLSGGQGAQSQYQVARQQLPFLRRLQNLIRDLERSRAGLGDARPKEMGSIELRDIAFSYGPGRPVLRGASLVIAPGELVAVVGPSGSGKSTLLQILLRLRQPDTGQYVVGGIPAQSIDRAVWAKKVAYVPQNAGVLHATVWDNIRFFRDIADDAVVAAARQAQIHDEIVTLPEGYASVLGQRVDALSGGQRQRLCLARALAGSPEILVLDEPTSALDERSESLVIDALARLKGSVTVIVVAHRPSILRVCDRVLACDEGVMTTRTAGRAAS